MRKSDRSHAERLGNIAGSSTNTGAPSGTDCTDCVHSNESCATGPDLNDGYIVKPLMKAIQVLQCVGQSPAPLRLKEIACDVGLPTTTVFRYLRTFEAAGMIVHQNNPDLYRIDTRLAGMVNLAIELERIRAICRPHLEQLQGTCAGTVNLAVLEGTDIRYLEIVSDKSSEKERSRIGSRDPANTTSLGKAILAHLAPEARLAATPKLLRRRTERSIREEKTLLEELQLVMSRGYAEEQGENEEGASCIGAPLFNASSHVVGAISISGPSKAVDEMIRAGIRSELLRVSQAISSNLVNSSTLSV